MRQAQESYRQEYASMPYDGPVYGCRREELMLPMQDGVRLYTEIFKPEGLAQFPVLIQRSCYPNQQPLYEINGAELTRRGYGYVVQTCRGTGKSEGHWEPNVNERPDGRDTLQWLNDQPWAESIGYFGASYLALTGWAIADIVPPKVKGMMLTVYGTDRFKSAYEKGLFRHDVLTGWAMQNAGHPVTADYLESCRFRPHDKVDEALWGGKLDWYQDWIHATRRTDAYWQQLVEAVGRCARKYQGSGVYHRCMVRSPFWQCINTYASLAPETKEHSWLDIGCWNHMSQPCIAWGEQHNLENGDIHRMLEWFDLLLKQKKQPEKRVRTYVMREDRWKTLEAWPAPVSRTEKLYLGETTLNAEPAEGKRTFVYDPETPVPSHGAESVLTTIAEAGSLLQPEPDYRPDVVSFVSAPLEKALPICGQIKVHLNVSTDVDDTAFTAKLMEVFPDAEPITSGAASPPLLPTCRRGRPILRPDSKGLCGDVGYELDSAARQLPAAGCLFFRLPAVRRSQQLRRSLVRTGKDPHRPPEDLAGGGQLCRTAPARELRERNQDHDGTGTKCPSERTAATGEPEGKADQAGAVPSSESLCKERGGGVCRFQPDGTVSAV